MRSCPISLSRDGPATVAEVPIGDTHFARAREEFLPFRPAGLVGFSALLRERYDDVAVAQRHWVDADASAASTELLGLAGDTEVLKTSKLYTADGSPAIHIRDEIPLTLFPESQREELRSDNDMPLRDSIFSLSKTWDEGEITHTVVDLVPAVAPSDESFPLGLSAGQPMLLLDETHYTARGEPVAYSRVTIDDHFVRLQVVRHL